jgi:hypothetical protein
MFHRLMRRASRFVLAAMLVTFLSPSFAWQAVATHDELEHAVTAMADHHVHEADAQAHEDEHEAHGFIGHLLGHMPVFVSACFTVPPSAATSAVCDYVAIDWPRISAEPPLRPPRFS